MKGHTRKRKGKVEIVRPHYRETESKDKAKVREVALEVTKDKELELWKTWKANGEKPEDLRPLLKSLKPLIMSEAYKFKGGKLRLSPASIDAEFYKQALAAIRKYDPDRGAKLGSWVRTYLIKARRFINQHQNAARIPENLIYEIREYQTAENDLEAKMGRPATDLEMAGYLKWPLSQVVTMAKSIRRDLWTHGFEEDPSANEASEEGEILKLLKYELNEDEKKVYTQYYDKGVRSTADIAKNTGFNIWKVSRIRKSIAEKVEKYLE